MMLVMILCADLILTYMRSMVGGGTHGLDVFLGEKHPHTFCITCSKGSMRRDMNSIEKYLFLYEEGHDMEGIPYGGEFLSIMYEMVWASLIHNAGRGTFGGLASFLPFEGNTIAAQDQKILYTCLKWRGRQCGVGYYVYHVQNFSPPTLPELQVEDDLHELPFWRVTHFFWLIAWGGVIQMGIMNPNLYQPPCFKRIFKQPIVASMYVLQSHSVSYLEIY